ncbi:DNA alkylation repair protein [Anaerofustis sp. NSJ-163]|uniref:DNA alkylation repair protein n=1 Tax=Anaerofustis sp. NSJ-163 TaxID=2944391 RepID=UPI00209C475F|nr:DNA alkylation repair protein [Anaerofustis sp. NSJ-163]MCO8193642.1 DNA alkylation repair protein [Anaerofustis sp. NSJ-163]
MDIFEVLYEKRDEENAVNMAKYMKNKFDFLGINKPELKKIEREYFKEIKNKEYIDYDFVNKCYGDSNRELQYFAIDYLINKKRYLTNEDVPFIKNLIVTKSWWDTSDMIYKLIADMALKYEDINEILISWSKDNNIWIRRVSIIHQLHRKEKTNTKLLEKIIVNNFGSDEFFINKAIGWALRDYSKTNKEWVSNFINKYKDKMSNLSIKEASKYL